MLVSILILVFGLGSLAQFSVAYCRTLLIAYSKVEISERTQQFARITSENISSNEFIRLMGFVRMAPNPGDDSAEIGTVKTYFYLMTAVRFIAAPISAHIWRWAERELARCAYFAAVSLDRRMPSPLRT